MSGLVIADARHATGQAGRVVRRYLADGGVYGASKNIADLRTVVPIDRVAAADLVLVRVSDREWVVTKDRTGDAGMVLGPEEVSELLGARRAQEYRGLPGTRLYLRDPRQAAVDYVRGLILNGEITLDGSDVLVRVDGHEHTFTAVSDIGDIK